MRAQVGRIVIAHRIQEEAKALASEIQGWLIGAGWKQGVKVSTKVLRSGARVEFVKGPLQSNQTKVFLYRRLPPFSELRESLHQWLFSVEAGKN